MLEFCLEVEGNHDSYEEQVVCNIATIAAAWLGFNVKNVHLLFSSSSIKKHLIDIFCGWNFFNFLFRIELLAGTVPANKLLLA